ncbi:MAG TPA: FtsX-like permease family protein [bacterium]|nr:FtsX-like permease family protein [bacterium]
MTLKKLVFDFFIALRYFRGKNNLVFIKIMNYISIIGVAIGVTTLIIVLGVMNGFDDYLQSKIIGVNSHITVMPVVGKYQNNNPEILDKINKTTGVILTSPIFLDNVLLRSEYGSFAVAIKGVIPELDKQITNIYSSLIEGGEKFDRGEEGLFIGVYLAKRLGVSVGDEITVIPAQITYSAFGIMPSIKKFKILGIFKTGMFEYDNSFAYSHLSVIQSLFKKNNAITGYEVKIQDIHNAENIAKKITETLNYELIAYSWIYMNQNLFAALKLEKLAMFIILTLIIAVAALNIASSIIVLIVIKTKEIGILRSLGVSQNSILRIFLIKGLLIGIIGAVSGLIIGVIASFIIQKYNITIPGDVYYIEKLPIQIQILDLVIICGTAVSICLLTSIYPAYRASKLNPIEAIRNE